MLSSLTHAWVCGPFARTYCSDKTRVDAFPLLARAPTHKEAARVSESQDAAQVAAPGTCGPLPFHAARSRARPHPRASTDLALLAIDNRQAFGIPFSFRVYVS